MKKTASRGGDTYNQGRHNNVILDSRTGEDERNPREANRRLTKGRRLWQIPRGSYVGIFRGKCLECGVDVITRTKSLG